MTENQDPKGNHDVVVVGGGPAGMIAAITARRYYPEKKVLLIKSVGDGVVPCGIPYMFNTLEKPEGNAMGKGPLEANEVQVKVDKVTEIDRENKKIKTEKGEEAGYEKLILATGSTAIKPPIEGIEKKRVYEIKKDLGHLKNLCEDVKKVKDIVIVGGGFIGIEFADELAGPEKNVTIVEMQPRVLANSFDEEFSELAKKKLDEKGIKLLTGTRVEGFNGGEAVESVSLSNGEKIKADLVVLGMGARPNSGLAERAGLKIGSSKGILVDEYLRTYDDTDIFAVGDCAEKKDFFTRKKSNVMLASTATAEARIAGANLYKIKLVKENKGTIATYSTQIGDLVLGSAGLIEQKAEEEGFELKVGRAECPDKHPGCMPEAKNVKVKLIFSKQSGVLLGGQVAGGQSAGELINVIGLALQKTFTLTEIETLQLATHPKLTAPPTKYPLIVAAQDALTD